MNYINYSVLLVLLLLVLVRCDRAKQLKQELIVSKETEIPTIKTEGPKQAWFEGHIVAKQDLSNSVGGLLTETIEYTIGQHQVKRELHQGGLNKLTKKLSGVVVDLNKKSVLLYQSDGTNKYYYKLSLDEYKAYILGDEDIEKESIMYPGYGTVFLQIPKAPPYTSKNKPNSRKLANLTCDVLEIYFQYQSFTKNYYKLEVIHCPEIKVNRHLIELTEPNIPKEVTGFPCTYNLYLLTDKRTDSTRTQTSRSLRNLLDKATGLLSEIKQEIESIEKKTVPTSEFSLPESYIEVASIRELNGHFPGDDSGGRGGDD
jgi:hypothetical protein